MKRVLCGLEIKIIGDRSLISIKCKVRDLCDTLTHVCSEFRNKLLTFREDKDLKGIAKRHTVNFPTVICLQTVTYMQASSNIYNRLDY